MKKRWITASWVGLAASAAPGQTIPASITNSLYQVAEDDGVAEAAFKLLMPTPPGEAYNVDFDTAGAGMTILGLGVELYATSNTLQLDFAAICGDDLAVDPSGRTPDLAHPLSILAHPNGGTPSSLFCTESTVFDLPDVTLGTGGVHGVIAFPVGDTATWICADSTDANGGSHTGARHSFYTTDSYATPASYAAQKWNYMIRLVGTPPTPGGGLFLINGVTAASIRSGKDIALQFWSSDGNAATQYLEFLAVTSAGPFLPLPAVVLTTGDTDFLPNGIQQLGVVSGTMPCATIGAKFQFGCFFSDNLDRKPDGKNKIKISNLASVAVIPSTTCWPNVCFGIQDDGTMDGFIFNPRLWYGIGTVSGPNDAGSVHMGRISPLGLAVTHLTAVEAATWDFCGTNPCWQQIGIYPSNTVLDPSGNTPDLASPLTSIGGSSACDYEHGGIWGFPAVVYDTPDIVASTAIDYHAAFEWPNGDSCMYIGLDLNGTGDDNGLDCVPAISGTSPVGSASFFSLDGFATPAVDSTNGGTFPVFNLMERIDWN
jgi:hypothetical protein